MRCINMLLNNVHRIISAAAQLVRPAWCIGEDAHSDASERSRDVGHQHRPASSKQQQQQRQYGAKALRMLATSSSSGVITLQHYSCCDVA
jgi:hypothetical protein